MGYLDGLFRFFQFGHYGLAKQIINAVEDELIIKTQQVHAKYVAQEKARDFYPIFSLLLMKKNQLITALGDMLQKKISAEGYTRLNTLSQDQRQKYLGLLANDYLQLIESQTEGFRTLNLSMEIYHNTKSFDDAYLYIDIPRMFCNTKRLEEKLGDRVDSILLEIEQPEQALKSISCQ